MRMGKSPQFGAHFRFNINTLPADAPVKSKAAQFALRTLELNSPGDEIGARFKYPASLEVSSANYEFGPKRGIYARIRPDNNLDIVCQDIHHQWLQKHLESLSTVLRFLIDHGLSGGIFAKAESVPSKPIKNPRELKTVIKNLDSPPPSGKHSRVSQAVGILKTCAALAFFGSKL